MLSNKGSVADVGEIALQISAGTFRDFGKAYYDIIDHSNHEGTLTLSWSDQNRTLNVILVPVCTVCTLHCLVYTTV